MNKNFTKNFGNKNFSIGVLRDPFCPFSILLYYNNKGDHFGWEFHITLFTTRFYVELIDKRHWNYKENRPETLREP